MKKIIPLLLVLALLPFGCAGAAEEDAMPADLLFKLAGLETAPDDATRARAQAFLSERGIDRDLLEMMPPERAKACALHLMEDLPIDYSSLLTTPDDAPALPADLTDLRALAVVMPADAICQTLIVNFERGWLYYDDARNITGDVCMARVQIPLEDGERARILEALEAADFGAFEAEPSDGAVLALRIGEACLRRYEATGHGGALSELMIRLVQPYW